MEEKLEKKVNSLTAVVVILMIIILGLGTFVAYKELNKKDDKREENEKVVEPTNTSENTKKESFDLSKFDGSKVINGEDGFIYKLNNGNDFSKQGFVVSINNDKKSATLTLNWNIASSEITGGTVIDGGIKNYTVTFDKKIKEVLFDGYGQAPGYEVILYLFEDGTVEYTPVKKYLSNLENAYEETVMKSYGSLSVNGIVDIVTADVIGKDEHYIGGWYTPILIKSDGTFYDLSKLLGY